MTEKKEEITKKVLKVKLKVAEAAPNDSYKGMARIDPEIIRALGLKKGDIISIKGDEETAAIVDHANPTDVGEGIIRIDGITTKGAKAQVGSVVIISKIEPKKAEKAVVAPTQEVVEELKEKDKIIIEQKKITKSALEVARHTAVKLGNETRSQVVTAIVAAFGFLIALVWKDTITGAVTHFVEELSFSGPPVLLTFYTTLLTTLIAVVGIVLITRWGKKSEPVSIQA